LFTKFGRAASGTLAHFGKKEDEILDVGTYPPPDLERD
jgi:hypothetical protein